MKIIPILAIANSTLAAASIALAAAPITGALLLFALWVPFAAYFARLNQTIAALCVPIFAALALAVSPIQMNHATLHLLALWCTWVLGWSAMVLYFSKSKLRALVSASRGGGIHGA